MKKNLLNEKDDPGLMPIRRDILTRREREVLDLYADQGDTEVIFLAKLLDMSVNTFNNHLSSIRRKMNTPSVRSLMSKHSKGLIREIVKKYEDIIEKLTNPVTPDPAPVIDAPKGAIIIQGNFEETIKLQAA